MGAPLPIADPASTLFPPVLGKAQRGIFYSPRLFTLGWCFTPIAPVMTIRFRVVGHEREEVCVFMIFPSHILPTGGCLSILRRWNLTSMFVSSWCILDFAIVPILTAIANRLAVRVLNVSLVFRIKLEFHTHVLDY